MDAIVQTTGLRKSYGGLTALDSVDLAVERCSVFGFIGPNGAGKTTCIKILCTLLTPDAGDATVDGNSVLSAPEAVRRSIGYMPDFFGVYDDMKVWEYLDFFERCYGVAPDRRGPLTDQLLDLVDLGEKKDAYVESLSRGMKQRLCLARTLVHDPELLILDEPASGLDPRARIEMRELLRELSLMGKTIILSSHILSELADVCTHIGIIERGRLLAAGRVDEMIEKLRVRRRVSLKTARAGPAAAHILSALPTVADIRFAHGETPPADAPAELSFGLLDDAADTADIVRALVESGVPVRALWEESGDLESLFLQVTKGEVQ